MLTEKEFLRVIKSNSMNVALLERLPELELPNCYLTAGCLFQTVWNHKSGCSLEWGIKDFDVFYCDNRDLSWEAENQAIQEAERIFSDLEVSVEIRNQARVHLWYESRFGHSIKPLISAEAGMDSFLISCTCVGINVSTGKVYAPDGFEDMWNGILRLNPANPKRALYKAKATSYLERWPWLTIAG